MNEFKQDYDNQIEKFKATGYHGYPTDAKNMVNIFALADLIRAKYEYEFLRGSDANEYLIFLQVATKIYFSNEL